MILDSFDPRARGSVKDAHQIVSVQWALEASELRLFLKVRKPRAQSSDPLRSCHPLLFPAGCNVGCGEIEEIVPYVASVKS